MNNLNSYAFSSSLKHTVVGSAQRAAIAWLVHACSFVPWVLFSSRAIKVVHDAEEGFGIVLSGVAAVHFCFLVIALVFAVTITGLLGIAFYKILQKEHAGSGHGNETRISAPSSWELLRSPETEPRCQRRALCTTNEIVFAVFLLWICTCVFWYARWMGGALAVAEAADSALFHGDGGTADGATPSVNRSGASGTRRLTGLRLSNDSSSDVYGTCPVACLNLRHLKSLQTPSCVCDRVALMGLYDNASKLYNALLTALTLLLVMHSSAAVALIYTSALLSRADGRSELEFALEEGERTFIPLPRAETPHGSSGIAKRDCGDGDRMVRALMVSW